MPTSVQGGSGALQVWCVGLNAWLVLTCWPWLFAPRPAGLSAVAAGLALAALTFGAVSLRRRPATAALAWLLVFPVLLGASLAALPAANRQLSLGAWPVLLGVLGLWAHGASCLWALGRSQPVTPLRHQPLASAAPEPREGPAVPAARTLAAALLGGGALAVGVLAPLWGEPQPYAARWGDAAQEGALLSAVVAAALGAAAAGPFLAALLRPAHAPARPRPDLALRVTSLVLLALLGAATYHVTR